MIYDANYKLNLPLRYHSVFLIVESLIFGLFVFAIICEQVTSIYNNEKSRQLSFYYSFKLVFKANNPILWFLPCEFSILNRNQSQNHHHHQLIENHYTV